MVECAIYHRAGVATLRKRSICGRVKDALPL